MAKTFILLIVFFHFGVGILYAGLPGAGASMDNYVNKKRQEDMRKRLERPDFIIPRIDAKEITRLPGRKKKVYVRSIMIQDPFKTEGHMDQDKTLFLVEKNINRHLSLAGMNALASELALLSKDDRIEAYIPRQSFRSGVLYINLRKKAIRK